MKILFFQKLKLRYLGAEITLLLILKIAALWLLWSLCFSHPVAKQDRPFYIKQNFFNLNR